MTQQDFYTEIQECTTLDDLTALRQMIQKSDLELTECDMLFAEIETKRRKLYKVVSKAKAAAAAVEQLKASRPAAAKPASEVQAPVDPETVTSLADHLKAQFDKYSTLTVRRIALATEVPYYKLMKAAKHDDPPAGSFNYEQMAFVLGADKVLSTDYASLAHGAESAPGGTRNRAPRNSDGTKTLDVSTLVPGQVLDTRRGTFNVIHVTETHIVLLAPDSTVPSCWAHSTLLLNNPKLVDGAGG